MEQQTMVDFILKQLPIIVFLSIVEYFTYKHFIKELVKKDLLIHEKDEEIKQLNQKLVEITRQCLDSTNKNNNIMEQLKELIKSVINVK